MGEVSHAQKLPGSGLNRTLFSAGICASRSFTERAHTQYCYPARVTGNVSRVSNTTGVNTETPKVTAVPRAGQGLAGAPADGTWHVKPGFYSQ